MKRYPKRAVHDKATIHGILDEVRGSPDGRQGTLSHAGVSRAAVLRWGGGQTRSHML